MRSSHVVLDTVDVAFDDHHAVAHAGLLLPATLAERLGIEQVCDQLVDLGDRPGAARPGRKLLTLVHTLAAGGDCIDDVEALRCGSSGSVLGHRVMAASTVGTWLRAFTFGHGRQLDRVTGELLGRAWQAGAGPGDGPLVIDMDSTICEVHGYHKQGACYGYTRRLGLHPLLAFRADTGEVLHARLRKGSANTARGIVRFADELVARVRRAGASGELTVRMDSGFWSAKLIARLRQHRVRYSITVRQTKTIRATIAAITEDRWADIGYTGDGLAQVAETPYRGDRLIVRRVRNLGDQQQLFATWRYHAFVTDRPGTPTELDADHRRHAVCELAIRDLKTGAGLAHLPSGVFTANAAWLLTATLAHNLLRWTASLGLGVRDQQTVAKTIRRFGVAGGVPLNPLQILWLNMIIDVPVAIAVGFDEPTGGLMGRAPRRVGAPVLSTADWIRLCVQGAVMTVSAIVAYQLGASWDGAALAATMLLTTLSLSHLLIGLMVRDQRNTIFRRAWLPGPTQLRRYGIALLGIIAATTIGFLQRILDTTDLSFAQWCTCIGLAVSLVVVEELMKLVIRSRERRRDATVQTRLAPAGT